MDRAHHPEAPPTWPSPAPVPPDGALGRQLALPLPPAALGPAARPPPTPVAVVRPRRVWAGLPPAARARVRLVAGRVLEEVVRDGGCDGSGRGA